MNAIKFCQNILQQKPVDWEPILRNNLSQPICNVDLVITVGGDGTLLQASHFMDDSVPVVGVNSDPTQIEEVSLILLKLPSYQVCVSMGSLCHSQTNRKQFPGQGSIPMRKFYLTFFLRNRWNSLATSLMLIEAQAIFVQQQSTTFNR